MHDLTILTVTNDNNFLELLPQAAARPGRRQQRMIVAGTIDEACSLLKTARPRLVVMHWARDTGSYDQLDRLLWTTTVQARRIPVLVIAERYRTDQATMMYRMGVSEYISRSHHLDQLGPVFSAYLPVATETAEAVAAQQQPGKTWSLSNHKAGTVASRGLMKHLVSG